MSIENFGKNLVIGGFIVFIASWIVLLASRKLGHNKETKHVDV